MPSPHRAGTGRLASPWLVTGAVVLPLALSVAWIPIRSQLPNVDVALALVLAVTACGATGRRSSVWVAAATAAAGFAFFDTRPYEHWVVSRQPDLETLVVLAVVSLVTGELATRMAHLRARVGPGEAGMQRVRELAALVASGAELVEVISAVGDDLIRLLDASAWSYEAGAPSPGAVVVERDGSILRAGYDRVPPPGPGLAGKPSETHPSRTDPSRSDASRADPSAISVGGAMVGTADIEVPVSGLGRVLGRYVVSSVGERHRQRQTMLVALTLTDQVGAALIAQAPQTGAGDADLDDPPHPGPALRVVE